MASVIREPGGRRKIQFVVSEGTKRKRPSIRLGKVSQHTAESIKVKVEHLLAAKIARHPVDAPTAEWLAGIDDKLYRKLVKVGLAPAREEATAKPASTLGRFLADYTAKRVDVKPATREVWQQVVRNLNEHFGTERDIATIGEGDADDFKLFLIGEGLATTTVHKRLQFARMFFRAAKRHKLIALNPFADVSASAAVDESRQRFVRREEIERILEVCNPTWRTIVALCRYGGLRCPSEVLSLRWQDVDLPRGRMVVTSPKTEHHPGKATRTVPIFAELRPYLDEADELAADGAEYVIGGGYREASMTPSGWRNCNLRTQFERLLKRAGVEPWPRLFHNLRASRETELAAEFPLHVVTRWLGNTPRIAMKHYLQVTDGDFERAVGGDQKAVQKAAHFSAKTVHKAAQHPTAGDRTSSHKPAQAKSRQPVTATACESMRQCAHEQNGEDRNHDLAFRGAAPFAANSCMLRAFCGSSSRRRLRRLASLSGPRATKAPQTFAARLVLVRRTERLGTVHAANVGQFSRRRLTDRGARK